jgi:DNA-binding response OmpR family regulator
LAADNNILIIEDELDLCLLLKEYFVRKHYSVSLAHTLADGKALFNELKPGIVILDNNLPDGTGWGSAGDIATSSPNTAIFLISADSSSVQILPEGVTAQILEKPISFTVLDNYFL